MDIPKRSSKAAKGQSTGYENVRTGGLSNVTSRYRREIRILSVVIFVAIVAIGYLYYYISGQVKLLEVPKAPQYSGSIGGGIGVISDGVLTYNYSNYIVQYARVHYSESNAGSANLSLTLYPSDPIEPIYLVNVESYCVSCFLGPTLLSALNTSLGRYGIIMNRSSLRYIDINNISSIGPNSTIIIPSGLIPNILLPNVTYTERCSKYTNVTLASLLSNGDTVIYVGRNFSRSVSCSGQIAQDSPDQISTVSQYYNTTDLKFAGNVLYFSNPTFKLWPGINYGTATSAAILNGTLIVLSNYPYSGWNNNASLLAGDLARVIESRFWINTLAMGNLSVPNVDSNNITIFTLNSMMRYSGTVSEQVNSSYGLLRLKLSNSNNFQEYELPLRYTYLQNGLISVPAVVPQTGQVQISAQVFNGLNNVIIGQVPVYNRNLSLYVTPLSIGQIGSTALYKSTTFTIPAGYYIAELRDQHNAAYSSALFLVANAVINPVKLDFQNQTFSFSALSDGQDMQGAAYTIGINGAYNYTGTVQNGVIKYTLPKNTNLNYGNGYFYITMLGTNYYVPYQYGYKGPTIPPLYIAFAIAAVFLIILNRVLVPTNVEEYFIDVPEMRPPKLEHARETPDAILGVFGSVNSLYHWRYMPLTPEEVRSGIANNIKYGNARMSITLRNTNAILNTLVSKGLLVSASQYYAPTKWMAESGHSIDYLAIYRRLRDFCIANAMLITELDSTSKADVIITRKGAQNYVKIYTSDMKIRDVEISQKAKTYIIFLDEEKRLGFMELLYKSYGNNAEILKLAINYGNVKLVDADDLGELKL